jgi:hypothetical protein
LKSLIERLTLAIAVLRGHVVQSPNAPLRCNKKHVQPGWTEIKEGELKALQTAADDLKVARGVIAGVGKTKEYVEMSEQTLGKQ